MKKLLCFLLLMLCWIPLLAHAEDSSFTVTDVTLKNDDGTSRQEILSELFSTYGAHTEIPVTFQTKSPADVTDIFILADGSTIGKFSPKDTLDALSCIFAQNTATVKIGFSGDLYFAYVQFHDTSPASATKSAAFSQWAIVVAIILLLLFLIMEVYCMCTISFISLAVSILGLVILNSLFSGVILISLFSGSGLIDLFIFFSIASVLLPPIAKKFRIRKQKKGKVLEIIAIVIAGFDFYMVISALTPLPIIFGYLGWVISGIAYKMVK